MDGASSFDFYLFKNAFFRRFLASFRGAEVSEYGSRDSLSVFRQNFFHHVQFHAEKVFLRFLFVCRESIHANRRFVPGWTIFRFPPEYAP